MVLLTDSPRAGKAEALVQPQHGLEALDGAPRRGEGLKAADPGHVLLDPEVVALDPLLQVLGHVVQRGARQKVCDMCGRPARRKRNLQDQSSARSGADMCAASNAAHMPRARMGVRGSGPIQDHALEAPVAKLVFLIPSR